MYFSFTVLHRPQPWTHRAEPREFTDLLPKIFYITGELFLPEIKHLLPGQHHHYEHLHKHSAAAVETWVWRAKSWLRTGEHWFVWGFFCPGNPWFPWPPVVPVGDFRAFKNSFSLVPCSSFAPRIANTKFSSHELTWGWKGDTSTVTPAGHID